MYVSYGLTPAPWMRSRTCPAAGLGVGISSSFRTSGPPNSWTRIAFIFWPPVLVKLDLVPLAIFAFPWGREILAEDGRGVPYPYEEKSASWHFDVLDLLEVIVDVYW